MRIENILVPMDFSESACWALENAYDLARRINAKVYVLYVQDKNTLRTAIHEGLLGTSSTSEELDLVIKQLTEKRFAEMLAALDCRAVEIECLSRRGNPKALISNYANEIHADIIVLGLPRDLMTKLRSFLLGSATKRLMRKSPCPILVIRHTDKAPVSKGP